MDLNETTKLGAMLAGALVGGIVGYVASLGSDNMAIKGASVVAGAVIGAAGFNFATKIVEDANPLNLIM